MLIASVVFFIESYETETIVARRLARQDQRRQDLAQERAAQADYATL
jgi:hypothetical protein